MFATKRGSQVWVTCDEGEFTVHFDDRTHVIAPGHIAISEGEGGSEDNAPPGGGSDEGGHDENK